MEKGLKEKLTLVMLGVMSYVLMTLLAIPYVIVPQASYLKLDFSDVPILIALFVFGFKSSVVVAAVRTLLHFLLLGPTVGNLIGDATVFVATIILITPLAILLHKNDHQLNFKQILLGLILGTVAMTIILSIANAWILTPLYFYVLGVDVGNNLKALILYAVIPFNLIKGAAIGAAFMVLYRALYPWLSKQKIMTKQHH